MKRLILPLILLAGCAHKTPEPQLIPVPTPCISKQPAKPNYPTVAPDAGLFERVQALLAERELRIAYEGEMEAVLSACS